MSTKVSALGSLCLALLLGAAAWTGVRGSPADAQLAAPAVAVGRADCGGEPATIVGTPGHDRIVGTNGPDVIVAVGGDRVIGKAGDDHICLSGGADVVLAGRGRDTVDGGSWGRPDSITGVDSVRLGPGRDQAHVHVFAPLEVRGGRGVDSVALTIRRDVSVTALAGPGRRGRNGAANSLHLWLRRNPEPTSVVVDRPAESFTVAGRVSRYRGFSEVLLGRFSDVTYIGTRARDHVHTHHGSLHATLGGGADTAASWRVRGDVADVVDGGPGTDHLLTGGGDDRLIGGPDPDFLLGGEGWDYGEDPVGPNRRCDVEEGPCVE